MEPTFDHLGPMASTVSDVALLLEVIAGYDDGRDHRQPQILSIPKYSTMVLCSLFPFTIILKKLAHHLFGYVLS